MQIVEEKEKRCVKIRIANSNLLSFYQRLQSVQCEVFAGMHHKLKVRRVPLFYRVQALQCLHDIEVKEQSINNERQFRLSAILVKICEIPTQRECTRVTEHVWNRLVDFAGFRLNDFESSTTTLLQREA